VGAQHNQSWQQGVFLLLVVTVEIIETAAFAWQNIAIEAKLTRNWLSLDYHHIEVRADQRLPITETGYRSLFFPGSEYGDADLAGFVTDWLDHAAQSKDWQCYVETSRKFSFF